jgi:hypothetical protein
MGRARPVFLDSVGDTGRAHMVPVATEPGEPEDLATRRDPFDPPFKKILSPACWGYCLSFSTALLLRLVLR